MTGEELAGPPGPKLARFVYFIGAGVISVVAINKWRDIQRKSLDKKNLKLHQNHQQKHH